MLPRQRVYVPTNLLSQEWDFFSTVFAGIIKTFFHTGIRGKKYNVFCTNIRGKKYNIFQGRIDGTVAVIDALYFMLIFT